MKGRTRKMCTRKGCKKSRMSRKTRRTRKTIKSGLGKKRFFSRMKGGDQPALIGAPYNAVNNLPGQAGIDGVSNYYKYNTYAPFDPQTQNVIQERDQTTLSGGSRRRGRKMRRGGGFLPQDLVNFGRNLTYGLGTAYNGFNGYPAPVNPMPYIDQLTKQIVYL